MRIRHVVCLAPPRLGGMGSAALRLCEGLAERGHEVQVIVPQTSGFHSDSSLIHPWPSCLVIGNGAILKHPQAIFEDVDVVHVHYPFFGVTEMLLWKRPPVPVVVTFHMDAIVSGWRWPFVVAQRLLLQTYLLKNATRLLASSFDYLSNSSAGALFAREPHRWQELPFFVETTVFVPAKRDPHEGLHALFVGVLDRAHLFKGLPIIFEALQKTAHVQLTVVGDGGERASLEMEAARLGLKDRVRFVGRLSRADLVVAYQQADVLLFPSTSAAEAFGLVALEAQSCGTPVIASNLPGVRTVVRDGETGLLVRPGSAEDLVAALNRFQDVVWRERLGVQARAWVLQKYQREQVLDDLEKIYQNVCVSPS